MIEKIKFRVAGLSDKFQEINPGKQFFYIPDARMTCGICLNKTRRNARYYLITTFRNWVQLTKEYLND